MYFICFFFYSCRIWQDGLSTHVLEGHSDAITSVSIINKKGCSNKCDPDPLLILLFCAERPFVGLGPVGILTYIINRDLAIHRAFYYQ